MNICIVSPSYPTKEGKGDYFFVEQLVNQFADLGHHCCVIAPVNLASKFGFNRPHVAYYEQQTTVKGGKVEVYRPRFYGRNIYINGVQWSAYNQRRSIERVIYKHHLDIDIIYAHFFRCGVLSWHYASTHNIPLIVATGESTIPQLENPCLGFSIEKFNHTVAGVVCVSTKNKNEALGLGYATEEKCIVIPNGVDLKLFQPLDRNSCRKQLGLSNEDFVLICVGNFSERKGQIRILAAIEKLGISNIKIILAGQGELSMCSSNVIYKGFVSHELLPTFLNASDAYVIPTRWEGCCNSIIEAMACGLPIISSNRSFNLDILNTENALLIDPDSVDEIAEAIKSLYENRILRNKLGTNALATAQGLSIAERAKSIIQFISERRINIMG